MAAAAHFDCPDIYREHGFLVRLTRGREAKALIFEVYGRPPAAQEAEWAPETVLRCELSREIWDVVAPEARSLFNRRLRDEGKPIGRWGAEETAVQRLLGKELLVLAWAVEAADIGREEVGAAVRNWHGLKPEERWWLYTMTAAATGLAHHAGLGWRGALRQALCFGTRADAFHLGAGMAHQALAPRAVAEADRTPGKRGRKAAAGPRAEEPGWLFPAPQAAE